MESYYNFYYNNEDTIKKYLKYTGYCGMSFFSGFILFYLFNYKRTKKLPDKITEEKIKDLKVEDLRKLLRKLINALFLKMSHSYDKNSIIKINPFEDLIPEDLERSLSSFIGNNIEIESEKIEEIKKVSDVVEIDLDNKSSFDDVKFDLKPDEEKLLLGEINKQCKKYI
jgi:hypothetical protein